MFYCIVNPSARSGHGKNIYNLFEEKCKALGKPYKIFFTKGPGHALSVVKRITDNISVKNNENKAFASADNEPVNIVVMGGDGTINEVISGIQDFDNVRLGVVPLGSGNDFVRDLNFPKDPAVLINQILKGEVVRKLDIGNVHYDHMTKTLSRLHDERISEERRFDVSAGIGFDAAVCEEALSSSTKNKLNKFGLGKLTYGIIAIRQILHADQPSCDIETDDGTHIHIDHLIFAAAMLHAYEGGGFKFAPDADPQDGYFDLIAGGDMSIRQIFKALPLAYFGKHYGQHGIHHVRAKEIKITTAIPLWVHTDGEVLLKSDSITLTCHHKKLNLLS
ncbi:MULTISPECIES: diacylglycerol/lipid kinase family protein [unclassified Butyrivibrio]|uniref:diacylglycerol/lipid kinase family protein n=1 Tax=unclassified Butyrivibrio TaxID=2639466 RepID=UPI00040C558E|nr:MULTISPECIES: YegS/Rv2252/BmrU family lipid kinase [unclassified Butyrivibrio]